MVEYPIFGAYIGGTPMINFNRDGNRAFIMLHAVLDQDFARYAHANGWEFAKWPGEVPEQFVAYELWGEFACDALERRINLGKNPWFAFTTVDEYP